MKTRAGINGVNQGRAIRWAIFAAAAGAILPAAVLFESIDTKAENPTLTSHTKINANGFTINLIAVDLSGGAMELASAGTGGYRVRSKFDSLVKQSGAAAAINGCFFDLKTGRLVGHIYTEGKRESEGSFSAAFAVDRDNRPVINYMSKLGSAANYKLIITCVDILMKDGKILVSSKKDLVRNGHNPSRRNDIYKPARWSAIGIGRDGRVYFAATNNQVSLYRFVREIKNRSPIADLLGLDGGISSAMHYGGKTIVKPARAITSIIVARPAKIVPAYIATR